MAGLDILTDATWEPIDLDLAKVQCQIDADLTDDDDYLTTVVIPGARELAEDHTNRSYPTRTFREYFDGFPGQHLPIPYNVVFDNPVRHQFQSIPQHRFELSRSPLQQVLHINYLDQSGQEQILDPSYYVVSGHKDPAAIYRASQHISWPIPLHRVDSVWVDYKAGYKNPWADDVDEASLKVLPAIARQAMLLLIDHWYVNRLPIAAANLAELPYAIKSLLDKNRVYYQA